MKIKKVIKVFIIFIVLLIIFKVFFSLYTEYLFNKDEVLNLNSIDLPEKGSNVLVIAPHNDDESLGSSIFIKKAIDNGCNLNLVMVTNGDGFTWALDINEKRFFEKPEDYIKFGYKRQLETIDAMTSLGVKEKNIFFLGYPDGGILNLWSNNFYKPFTSPFTKVSSSPYSNSFTKDTLYTGESLAFDLNKIITEVQPDYIIYPHPNDKHNDHWATHAFTKYILSILDYTPKKELLYLVHRGDWPTPLGLNSDKNLFPPFKLKDKGTSWYSLDLMKDEVSLKESILRKYKTQFPVLEELILAFVRKNELFGLYPDLVFLENNIASTEIKPSKENLIIDDPIGDFLKVNFSKGGDIKGIYGEISKEKSLNLFMEINDNIEKLVNYKINLTIVKPNDELHISMSMLNKNLTVEDLHGNIIKNIKADQYKNFVSFIVPYDIYENYNSILINGNTFISNKAIDRTALRVMVK